LNSVSDPKLTWKLIIEVSCSKINNKDNIKTVIYNEQKYDVNNDLKVSNIFLKKIENIDVINIVNNCMYDTAAGLDKITIKLLKCIIEL